MNTFLLESFLQPSRDQRNICTSAVATVEYGEYSVDFQYRPFGDTAVAQVIEISLNPLLLQITQSTNLEIHRHNSIDPAPIRVFENDLKDTLRYCKLVHLCLSGYPAVE